MTITREAVSGVAAATSSDDAVGARKDAPGRLFARLLRRLRRIGRTADGRPAGGVPQLDRAVARYGCALALVLAAELAADQIQEMTGHMLAFPFYVAVVGSAWFGLGPGMLAVLLSALLAADMWAPPRFDWDIAPQDLPSYLTFLVCALMSFAWSFERRRVQEGLETAVQQRTADLAQANVALQAEMAERELLEDERAQTERALRDAEAELARMLRLAAMAELAATIAHEINQPLAAITANGSACVRSLSRQPPLLDTAREAAQCIVDDGHRAGEVIARIRALFSKEQQPKHEVLSINDAIRQALELSRGAIERERVSVRAELAAPPPSVMADPVQLQQVMVNLVTNAVEAMTDTGDRPRLLRVRSEVAADDNIVVTVEDSGSGFGPDHVTHIFDSFYTTKADGIGVGLAISRSIIEAHGGSMWAAPGARAGARVGFTLPPAAGKDREP